VDNLWITCG